MNIKPLYDRVVIKRDESLSKTPGGLLIPQNSQKAQAKGEVTAIGTGYQSTDGSVIPLTVKVGDKVIFNKFAIVYEDKDEYPDFVVVKESDIIGIL